MNKFIYGISPPNYEELFNKAIDSSKLEAHKYKKAMLEILFTELAIVLPKFDALTLYGVIKDKLDYFEKSNLLNN